MGLRRATQITLIAVALHLVLNLVRAVALWGRIDATTARTLWVLDGLILDGSIILFLAVSYSTQRKAAARMYTTGLDPAASGGARSESDPMVVMGIASADDDSIQEHSGQANTSAKQVKKDKNIVGAAGAMAIGYGILALGASALIWILNCFRIIP